MTLHLDQKPEDRLAPEAAHSESERVDGQCRTFLVTDSPANEDAFSTPDEHGPHRRVARAVVDVVRTEDGGRAIGLEGTWGSGKSSVVQLVRSQLAQSENCESICFDAWAHEGDPLRRTYLETLVRQMQRKGWVDQKLWDDKLAKISRRRRETTTRTTPRPTRLARWLALAVILVPLGTALVATDWGSEITLEPGHPLAVGFIAGLLLSLGPLIVWCIHWLVVVNQKAGSSEDAWQLLISNSVTDSTTETIETPDPTSIEFADYFDELTQNALAQKPERRLLLVLDNLDRVEQTSALAIWSTLQTFLQERHDADKPWFKRIWVLVPYDPQGIKRLWDTELRDSEDTPGRSSTTETFLDKSFQIRFSVPPPVLSDWKSFLLQQLSEAMPDHDRNDWHKVYRIFEACRPRPGMPTLRELKLFVNQLGAIHRQWQDDFPLDHVAFYVLHTRDPKFLKKLRDGESITPDDFRLLGSGAERSFAGLVFNVKPSKGMELLLTDPIRTALTTGDGNELRKLADAHPYGFLPVLEKVVDALAGADFAAVGQAALALEVSDVLKGGLGSELELRTILNDLRAAAINNDELLPKNDSVKNGIGALLRLQNSEAFTKSILSTIATELTADPSSLKANEVVKHLVEILRVAFDSGHGDQIPQYSVPCDVPQWKQVCVAMKTSDPQRQFSRYFKPTVKFNDIADALGMTISEGKFNEHDLDLIEGTTKALVRTDWKTLPPLLAQRLEAGIGAPTQESRWLLTALWKIRRSQSGGIEATSALRELSVNGHILHHLHEAQRTDPRLQAMCLLTFLEHSPDLSAPTPVGNSAGGHTLVDQQLKRETALKELLTLSEAYGPFHFMFDVFDKRGTCDPLVRGYFKKSAASTQLRALFPSERFRDRWPMLQKALGDEEFSGLAGQLTKETNLIAELQQSGFDSNSAYLYRAILGEWNEELVTWITQGMVGMDKQSWTATLRGEFECVRLLLFIGDNIAMTLPTPFGDALSDHAKSFKGIRIPPADILKRWSRLPTFIGSDGTRAIFLRSVLDAACKNGAALSTEFLDAFGSLLSDVEVLKKRPEVTFAWFKDLLEARHVLGLRWVGATLESMTELAADRSSDAEDFRARVQESLNEPKDDDAQPIINEIGTVLGLAPEPGTSHVETESPLEPAP